MASLGWRRLLQVSLPSALLLALLVAHAVQRRESVTLLGEGDVQESGWRWVKQGANAQTPSYYEHPLAHIGDIDPYTDLPRATVRGLPDITRKYDMSWTAPPVQTPGMKTVFSTNRATHDLEAMKEFGLVSDEFYARKKHQIDSSSLDPFVNREGLPQPADPEGWSGPTKMCRDVKTHVSHGLNAQGWAQLHTLQCCSYLCSKDQWQALRVGQVKAGFEDTGRSSTAVDTGTAGVLANGSARFLCKSCAWYKEPTWDEISKKSTPAEVDPESAAA